MADLNPGGVFAWILVGLLAGWIAGQLTRGHGFGCFGNVVIGFLGAIIGGLLFSAIGATGTLNFIGSVAVATLGAVILLAIANLARR
jgi:uncharacterized membrane protein YeaQ/YmgE (transglycosylase-associated protein family)